MKKLIISLVLSVFCISTLSYGNPFYQEKKFQIHTEKRPFVKKGERHGHRKHHHHKKKNGNRGGNRHGHNAGHGRK